MRSAQNRLHFALRNFLSWPGPAYPEKSAEKTENLEALTYSDWLDCFFQAEPQAFRNAFQSTNKTVWLDVGAKNWTYLDALTAFLQAHAEQFELHGIELDPHRRYVDLRTRKQAALSAIAALPESIRSQVTYHSGDILHWRQPAHIISHFLPFVFKEPHLAWGLPLNTFKPQAVLRHELSLLQPSGLLLIVNQGEDEAQAQQELLAQAANEYPIRFQSLGQMPARFIQYQYPRYGWICIKHGSDSHSGIPQ